MCMGTCMSMCDLIYLFGIVMWKLFVFRYWIYIDQYTWPITARYIYGIYKRVFLLRLFLQRTSFLQLEAKIYMCVNSFYIAFILYACLLISIVLEFRRWNFYLGGVNVTTWKFWKIISCYFHVWMCGYTYKCICICIVKSFDV